MSLTGSLSDLQISIPFFVPSASEQGPGLGSGRSQGVCEARAAHPWGAGSWELGLLRVPGDQESPVPHESGPTCPERGVTLCSRCPHTHPSPLKHSSERWSWERRW